MKIPNELKSMLLADVRGILGQHLNSDEEALLRCFEISIAQFLPDRDKIFREELERRWPDRQYFSDMVMLKNRRELYYWLKSELLKPEEQK
jgi:hypothetical protein